MVSITDNELKVVTSALAVDYSFLSLSVPCAQITAREIESKFEKILTPFNKISIYGFLMNCYQEQSLMNWER